MNFDLDDPLGDILSEGSNDSFFESGKKASVSKPTPKPSSRQNVAATPPKETKNKMADLFGISTKDDVRPPTAPQPSSLTGSRASGSPKFKDPFEMPPATHTNPVVKDIPKVVIESRKPESPAATKSPAPIDDDNDDLDFGFDLKKIKTKTGILNDLLGVEAKPIAKKPTQAAAANKPISSPVRAKTAPSPKKINSRITETDSSAFGDYAPSNTRRGGRRSSNQLNDPLGLFSDDPVAPKKEETHQSQRAKPKSVMAADWLGLDQEEEVKAEPKRVERTIDPVSQTTHAQYQQPATPNQQYAQSIAQQVPKYELPQMHSMQATNPYNPDQISHTTQMMNLSNREAENALYELKQQEMQIMFASQIRNQEHALMDIQNRQETLIKQQEGQFNNLLQKQIERQQILEENIKMQQERINAHIHVLLSQPNSKHKVSTNETHRPKSEQEYHHDSSELHVIEIESEMKRLEYEKIRLENLVANLTENHDQEINMLDQSYKKQIELLSANTTNMEGRLREENKNLEEFFERKINLLQTEMARKAKDYEQRIEEINQEYDSSIKKIKNLHEIELEDLKNDSRSMIENIRQSKLLEFSIVQENQSYLQTLKNASKFLENASGDIQTLRDTIQDKLDIEYKEKQIDLELKEKRLNEQEKKLNQLHELNEIEKNRLLDLIKNLETKLIALTQTSAEDEWNYKQKIKNLESERIAFERERQFFRDQQVREQKNLEETKKLQNADYQTKLNEIETEKIKLFNEKSKFEIMSRVHPNHAQIQQNLSPGTRIEIETAVKVAEDAARQADQERERLMDMQRKCEIKKRELIDKENALRDREKKFEIEMDAIKGKERNAENAVRSAKQSEHKVIAKLQILQKHSNALTAKEAILAKEKLAITTERVELQQLRQQLYESRCSLCKLGERSQQLSDILNSAADSMPHGGNEPAEKFDLETLDVERLDRILDREVEESMTRQNDDSYSFEVNIDNIPNIEDIDDQFLDPEIYLLKLEAMNK